MRQNVSRFSPGTPGELRRLVSQGGFDSPGGPFSLAPPGRHTGAPVWQLPGAEVAWFKDPEGNLLSLFGP